MTYYLNYQLKNESPLRFADDSLAKQGQTETLHYIPGSAVRGFVISALAKDSFLGMKEELFLKSRFLNAYPMAGKNLLFPSPKGFYEDKAETEGKKELVNVVVNGDDIQEKKRARLGEFCRVSDEKDSLIYYSVNTGGDLKLQRGKTTKENMNLFRVEHIDTGYVFGGAIASESKALLEKIDSLMQKEITLGNARSAGMGRCEVLTSFISSETPFGDLVISEDQPKECYMMLLSPVSMRDQKGEPVGLDLTVLEEKMGVQDLKIKFCSTSIRNIQGYNRAWKGRVPSVAMYEKGSVFHLEYDGALTVQKAKEILDQGLGERLYEGFGRVVFLRGYDTWKAKEKGSDIRAKKEGETIKHSSDEAVLKSVARKYYRELIEDAMDRYIVTNPLSKGTLKTSKARGMEPILIMNRYDYKNAVRLLKAYFNHEAEKEENRKVHKEQRSSKNLQRHVFEVIDGDLDKLLSVESKHQDSVMSIPKDNILSDEEKGELKLIFLLKELRFDSRQEEKA